MRNRPGSRPSSPTSGPGSAGAGHGPVTAVSARPSSAAAVSRIVRVTTPSLTIITAASNDRFGITRPLRGLQAHQTAHCDAGMRIDPAMSFAWATGT